MTHVEHGELQAYLDGEVTHASRADIETHLRSCAACSAELDAQRAAAMLFASAMRGADVQAPTTAAFAAVTAARRPAAFWRPAGSRAALARAAMLILGLAALASAAIPGSPVRNWITGALRSAGILGTPTSTVQAPAPAAIPESVPAAPANAAISIQPAAGRIVVILSEVAKEATVRVKLIDGDRAQVQTSGGAERARFSTGPGRIELRGVTKGEVTVELPRNAQAARVEVDGKVLYQR